MGRQISLLLTNEDLRKLDGALQESGDTTIYFDREDDRLLGILPIMPSIVLTDEEVGHVSLMCIVAPSTNGWRLQIDQHSPIKRRVNVAMSDVIELFRPYCKDGLIRRGRLWYEPRPFVGDAYQEKSEQFLRWADRVFRRVRRALAYSKSEHAYLGEHAAALIAAGEIRVVS